MKRNEAWILVIFFLFVGPGPIMLMLNKYTVSLAPLGSMIAILWLLKQEIKETNLEQLLKSRSTYAWAFQALKYAIFAHALTTLLFRPPMSITESLLDQYLVMPFYVIALGPIMEEIAYRKIIFGLLNRRFHFWVGAIISSAIFAVAHFSIDRVLGYFAVGLIFCYVYKKSESIVPTMLAHASLNYISVLMATLRG